MSQLRGKSAIVTGAASGIGRASALRFAAAGAAVAVVDLRADRAQRVVDEISAQGGRAIGLGFDVSVPEQVEAMVREAHSAFGRLDVVFSNAATTRPGDAVALSTEDWSLIWNTNVTAVFLAAKFAVPIMAAQGGGSLLATASVSALLADAGQVAYAATKAAVAGLIRALAVDHAAQGIRANCIAPGITGTPPMTRMLGESALAEVAASAVPRNAIAAPEEIAAVALFLASEDASFVNGQTIVVDGAMTARSHFSTIQAALAARSGDSGN